MSIDEQTSKKLPVHIQREALARFIELFCDKEPDVLGVSETKDAERVHGHDGKTTVEWIDDGGGQ